MRDNFLVFGAPLIEDEEVQAVISVLNTGWLGTGPLVENFEEEFKKFKGSAFAKACSSCTAALHLSLTSMGVGKGDEVITSAMTFCSTVNAIIHTGATPVLADVDPITYNVSPDQIKKKITKKTRALIPVHFAGNPCKMDDIMMIAKQHNLSVVEDCAHAVESLYNGVPVGTIGDFGCFSFYANKNISTGEGGMITTKEAKNFDRISTMSLHGMSSDAWKRFSGSGYKHYDIVSAGYKYNFTDMQAAIGLCQLKKIDRMWLRRQQIWHRYKSELEALPVVLPVEVQTTTSRHAYHLFPIQICENAKISRDEFLIKMKDANIGVGVHYRSITEYSYYKDRYGWDSQTTPIASQIGERTVSLPLYPKMTDYDVTTVIQTVKQILGT